VLESPARSRSSARRAAALAAVTVAVVSLTGAGGLFASAAASADASRTRVTVRITDSRIVFAPSHVPTGTLVFTVHNRTSHARAFGIGARRTSAIAAGRSGTLTVTFTKAGERTFSSVATASSRHSNGPTPGLTGALYLYEPCTHPVATTVNVRMASPSAGGLMLSQSQIPCGTVTFDVTDVDEPATSFLASTVVPALSDVTNQLDPGETATFTLRSVAKTVVHCDAVQYDGVESDSFSVGYASLTLS
jgi:plastocyanin